ncbi:GntR family transcriptional regulator [Kordiimonas lipolytica]|uniref:GntR family transcriptional regulator n=1 Tax=Kordiimonas lipolytica TaxID=1662421 RepID=A0ABV8UFE6_9PROT|nr:GntR family transcriptional regulator [Kordiimonas lipolytica]
MQLSDIIGPLDTKATAPKYQLLSNAIRQAVERGALKSGQPLPAERDIAEDMGVSRVTVRKALDSLAQDGFLERRRGAGTFVSGPVSLPTARLASFSETMAGRGRKVRSEWIDRAEGVATPEECMGLGLAPGARVYRLTRIRYADDSPMALETATVPAFALAGAGPVAGSLYQALEETGHRPVRALERLRAVNLNAEQAARLGVPVGDAGLLAERRGFLANGKTVEMTRSYYRGDAYDFIAELKT